MIHRYGKTCMFLAWLAVTVAGESTMTLGERRPAGAHAWLAAVDEVHVATQEATPPLLTYDDQLAVYAARLVHLLQAERERLVAWQQRLTSAQAVLHERRGVSPHSPPPPREREAAQVQRVMLDAELKALQSFLGSHPTLRSPVPPESLMVRVSIQWLKTQGTVRTAPSSTSVAHKIVPQGQPLVVLAEVRGTVWRVVYTDGSYGFIASDLLEAR